MTSKAGGAERRRWHNAISIDNVVCSYFGCCGGCKRVPAGESKWAQVERCKTTNNMR